MRPKSFLQNDHDDKILAGKWPEKKNDRLAQDQGSCQNRF